MRLVSAKEIRAGDTILTKGSTARRRTVREINPYVSARGRFYLRFLFEREKTLAPLYWQDEEVLVLSS